MDALPRAAAPTRLASNRGWREILALYTEPDTGRIVFCILTSVVSYLALLAAMYVLLPVSYLLVLLLAIPAGGCLVRTYIVFHDCAHGSFLASKRGNEWLGAACALLVFTPFQRWRHQHAIHHASSGDLDRRGTGDVPTLTVAEYRALPPRRRLAYRLFRNPIVMFGLGPLWLLIQPRFISRSARPRIRRSVWLTNGVLAVAIAGLCVLVGWEALIAIELPPVLIAGSVGIWLFYVQHQFEDAYWQRSAQWSYDDAALRGSSYLHLPRALQFFTGNIGFHHVHHLCTKIPHYNLQAAHDAHPALQAVPTLTLLDAMRCVKLKLWDEELGRLVSFKQAGNPTAAFPAADEQP